MKDDLINQLEFFSEMGVTHLSASPPEPDEGGPAGPEAADQEEVEPPRAPSADTPAAGAVSTPAPASAPTRTTPTSDDDVSRPPVFPNRVLDLEELRDILGDCRRCPLSETRTQIVFGVGNVKADLMFVGEAPGGEEDALGLPFVGAAGQLLSRIIRAIDLYRDQVYVANILKCRPPGNRDPQPPEVDACGPFLGKQVESVDPMVIVALGRYASQTLLNTSTPISSLRGRFQEYRGIPLMPTFHPSYLLRNAAGKKPVWQDMQAVRDKLKELGSRYYR